MKKEFKDKIERYNSNRKMNTKEQLETLWQVVNNQQLAIMEMGNEILLLKEKLNGITKN